MKHYNIAEKFATSVQLIHTRWEKRYRDYSFSNKHFFFQ